MLLASLFVRPPLHSFAKQVGEDAQDAYVITNNHNLGKAPANALEISSILKGELVPVPPTLPDSHPELRNFSQ